MSAYISVSKLSFINGMQYRAAAYAGMVTPLFFGLVFIMIFVAFYSHSSQEQPISLKISYLWQLEQVFLAFIMLWFRDNRNFSS